MPDFSARAADLLAQMTFEEKLDLTIGADNWATRAIPRLGIPSITMTDGPHGVRKATADSNLGEGGRSVPATCFPTASALACSWDPALVQEVGAAIGAECLAQDVQILLGPGVNMKRTPLCGRNFEYYSEDPYLAAELGAAFVRGVQSRGVGTSLKHFACNNQEWERMAISAEVDERPLREIYLRAFERIISQAAPWTVMCSYNRLNGTPAAEHRWLLSELLRDAWGYRGVVISDWGAVDDAARSLAAGLDLEMPGPGHQHSQKLAALVRAGALAESIVDQAAQRLLELILRADAARQPQAVFDVQAHHALARRGAAACMVLLKNEHAVLPLEPRALRKVALIGRFGEHPRYQGAGSSRVNPTRLDLPRQELERALGAAQVIYVEGYDAEGELTAKALAQAVAAAQDAEAAVVLAGLPERYEAEGLDRETLAMPEGHNRLIEAVCRAQPRTAVVLMAGAAVEMPWYDDAPAVLLAGLGGQAVGGALADVLTGAVEPGGRLAETVPLALRDTPAFINYPGEAGRVRYGEGIYIGYRYYEKKELPVRAAFGSGLGYAAVACQNVRLSSMSLAAGETLTVSAELHNNGSRAGRGLVQLYVERPGSQADRPPRELKAFASAWLEPGATHWVDLHLAAADLATWDCARGAWYLDPGRCRVQVGCQADAQPLTAELTIQADPNAVRLPLTRNTTIQAVMADPAGQAALTTLLQDVPFAGDDLPPEERRMMLAVPIGKLVQFGLLTEEQLQALLALANQG